MSERFVERAKARSQCRAIEDPLKGLPWNTQRPIVLGMKSDFFAFIADDEVRVSLYTPAEVPFLDLGSRISSLLRCFGESNLRDSAGLHYTLIPAILLAGH